MKKAAKLIERFVDGTSGEDGHGAYVIQQVARRNIVPITPENYADCYRHIQICSQRNSRLNSLKRSLLIKAVKQQLS